MNSNIIYQYIAESDPYSAKAICNKYGLSLANATSSLDIAGCLEDIVGEHGQSAFLEILALHPDKDVIVEAFGQPAVSGTHKTPCGCSGATESKKKPAIESYVPAPNTANPSMQQANIFLMTAGIIIVAAIILK